MLAADGPSSSTRATSSRPTFALEEEEEDCACFLLLDTCREDAREGQRQLVLPRAREWARAREVRDNSGGDNYSA